MTTIQPVASVHDELFHKSADLYWRQWGQQQVSEEIGSSLAIATLGLLLQQESARFFSAINNGNGAYYGYAVGLAYPDLLKVQAELKTIFETIVVEGPTVLRAREVLGDDFDHTFYVGETVVEPAFRANGVRAGRALTDALLAHARKKYRFLAFDTSNEVLEAMYNRRAQRQVDRYQVEGSDRRHLIFEL